MKKLNKKGFSKVEFMTMFAVIAILTAIGVKLVSDNSKNYGAFKNLANNFANSVAKYKDNYPTSNNIYYLDDVIRRGFSDELKNPIDTTEKCDKFESYVEVPQTNTKIVKLLCGDYYVEGTQGSEYMVYELGEITDEKVNEEDESIILYNYSENGKEMLNEYVTFRTFIKKYKELTGNTINDPSEVSNASGLELLTKNVYRTKTLVKEIK